jgi:hypothetical protein
MKNSCLVIISLLLLSCNSETKKTENKIVAKTDSTTINYDTVVRKCICVDTNRVIQGIHVFPFNKASKVIAYLYFTNRADIPLSHNYENLIKKGKFTRKNILQTIMLNSEQKDNLEKLFFNKTKKCNNGNISMGCDCTYIPSHAFVFYNDKDSAIAFIEVDLHQDEMEGMYMKKDDLDFGPLCDETMCNIKYFLLDLGFSQKFIDTDVCDKIEHRHTKETPILKN